MNLFVLFTYNILNFLIFLTPTVDAFLIFMSANKEMYGVKNSGWKSNQWNWGSAVGTGHDCAAICRRQYATRQKRQELVKNLLEPAENPAERQPQNFEEVKLVLGLAWQKGRRDGSDGGSGGYSEVLQTMAEAKRYEDDAQGDRHFVEDIVDRFDLLADNTSLELREMRSLLDNPDDIDFARRKAAGLTLDAMGWIEKKF